MLFVFGIAGMALTALGTYGLVSYTVKQSTREIENRIALGGPHRSVVRGFLTRGPRLGAIGAGIGVVTALMLGQVPPKRAVRRQRDGRHLLRGFVTLGGVVLGTVIPAWRAARPIH